MASRQTKKSLNNSRPSIKEFLQKNAGALEPQELDQLLALALHKKIEYIYKKPEKLLSHSTILSFKKLLRKRLAGWSLAYLKGYKEFYGLKFLVSKNTLIPRPESELIIDEALKFTQNKQNIIDIGTGTGCLILSLAKNNNQTASYLATDISLAALKTARTNARKLGLNKQIKFLQSNLLKKIPAKKFAIVMANLPYLTPQQLKEPSIQKEPRLALLAGKDGLNYYRQLLEQLPNYLADKYLILLEIDPAQHELIKKIIKAQLPQAKIEFLKDLANNIRIVKVSQ
ncbi:peptide chain release factor N(5)-glutamine methyltransferase [Candidatus Parcubacteria bacterium]|nr:MAG: peptide chain release factor N(5)-glutamine methyltransferase [Candidatus Parcubacteria bacterium]